MATTDAMGYRIALSTKTRCDYCHRGVLAGYRVVQGPTTGFFCGAPHYRAALDEMNKIKEGMDSEVEDEE